MPGGGALSNEHHSLELVEAELPPITVDHAAQIDARSLVATLLTLDEHFRVPLALFYFEQLSYKEIAEMIHVPDRHRDEPLGAGQRIAPPSHGLTPCQ